MWLEFTVGFFTLKAAMLWLSSQAGIFMFFDFLAYAQRMYGYVEWGSDTTVGEKWKEMARWGKVKPMDGLRRARENDQSCAKQSSEIVPGLQQASPEKSKEGSKRHSAFLFPPKRELASSLFEGLDSA